MLDVIPVDDLDAIVGGASEWEDIRSQAAPHCPRTVTAHPNPPANRSEALAIGDACVSEMDGLTAIVARRRIRAGIDKIFPP